MKKTVNFTRAILGLGLASSLFLGCEQFLGQSADKTTPVDDKTLVNTAPENVSLQLAIKETEDCKALRDRVLAAHAVGEAPGALETDFISRCVVEVKPDAGADAGKIITVPAALVPDAMTRCRWIVAQIEGGANELVIKFRYYCPDDCDTLAVKDSVRHVKLCRDPAPDCATMKRKLVEMDTATEEYARLRRFLHEHCGLPDPTRPPKDTVRPIEPKPVLTHCDSLRKHLGTLDPATEEYRKLKAAWYEHCEKPRDTVIVPKPDPIPAPTTCESLRKQLAALDPASPEYAHLKEMVHLKCEVPRDTVIVPKPDPHPTECEQIMAKLKALDPASPDYARLKAYYAEKCMEVKPLPVDPIKPLPVPTPCEDYRRKLASVPADSPDAKHLMEIIAKECAVPVK